MREKKIVDEIRGLESKKKQILLIDKFPDFNPTASPKKQLDWFDQFKNLLRRLRRLVN